jgi:NADPH:quinone reductase-like Zn-dependent oxidoreductase
MVLKPILEKFCLSIRMKAAVLHGINQPFVFQEFEKPILSDDEYLVKIKHAALNHRDIWIQKGQYAGLTFPIVCGSDGCGVIVSGGSATNNEWVGKEVIINPSLNWGDNSRVQNKDYVILGLPHHGTFAEYVKIKSHLVHEKPAHLSSASAAALPLAGLTAWRALMGRAKVKSGESVFVTGIGGGVALFAAQFAKANGCKVFVSSSSDEKLATAKQFGFDGFVNYKSQDWHKALGKESGGFDVIVDGAGGEDFSKLIDLAKPGGRIAIYGATAGNLNTGVPAKIFWKQLDILGSTMGTNEEFSDMLQFVSAHKLVPTVSKVFGLNQCEAAARFMDESQQFGKIILEINQI